MIGIIDTGGANLASLQNAFDRLGVTSKVTRDINVLDQATHLILPGVGHAKVAMEKLNQTELIHYIKVSKKPTLGICLGMQLLFSELEEGDVKGLNIIPGKVTKLKPTKDFPVPHMGWTTLKLNIQSNTMPNNQLNSKASKLLDGISILESFYFVHSFVTPMNEFVTSYVDTTVSESGNSDSKNYVNSQNKNQNNFYIPATIEYKNFYGAQFHPEKSGLVGEKLLKNFLKC